MKGRSRHSDTNLRAVSFQFDGLTKPVYDETLSSWLVRIALSESVMPPWVTTALDMITAINPEFDDPDQLYMHERLMVEMTPGVQRVVQRYFHISEALHVPYAVSNAYCPQCLQGDIAAGRAPSWRRAWRLKGRALCHAHPRPVLLSRLTSEKYDTAKKAWAAFSEYVESPAPRLKTNYVLTYFPKELIGTVNDKLNALLKRVENWYVGSVLMRDVEELSPEAANFLLVLWMYHLKSTTYGSGVAISLAFNSRRGHPVARTTAQDPLSTIYTANPRVLAIAYWLLGMSYGVITLEEATFIQKALYSNSVLFPIDRGELAAYSRSGLSSDFLRPVLKVLGDSLPDNGRDEIAWLGLPSWLA